jgi:hypothetical protein
MGQERLYPLAVLSIEKQRLQKNVIHYFATKIPVKLLYDVQDILEWPPETLRILRGAAAQDRYTAAESYLDETFRSNLLLYQSSFLFLLIKEQVASKRLV